MSAACNLQGERAPEFSFSIAQSQYFVVLIQKLFYSMAKIFFALHSDAVAQQSAYVVRQKLFPANSVALHYDAYSCILKLR